jgi:hypothetical protein
MSSISNLDRGNECGGEMYGMASCRTPQDVRKVHHVKGHR